MEDIMRLTFYKNNSLQSYSMNPIQHPESKATHIWIDNEEGEGGTFPADEVADVIYQALDRYFKENH
jgi:hypothetical protein